MTFIGKRVFPSIWFGGVVLYIVIIIYSALRDGSASALLFVMPVLLMATCVYWILNKWVFGIADVVLDAGDALVIRKSSKEERISLSDICSVKYMLGSPARVTLLLGRQTVFGDTIVFWAPQPMLHFRFRKLPVIDRLMDRVHDERRKQSMVRMGAG